MGVARHVTGVIAEVAGVAERILAMTTAIWHDLMLAHRSLIAWVHS